MILTEKLTIRFNKIFSNGYFQFVFWEISFIFYIFLIGENNIFRTYSNTIGIDSVYLLVTFISLITSLIFAFIDIIFTDRIVRFFPIRLVIIFKSTIYFIVGLIIAAIAVIPSVELFTITNLKDLLSQLPVTNIHLFRFIIYFYVFCFFNGIINGAVKKVGPGNFNNWIFGLLNKPREEERIFMFIDLKSSTTIAEKLGHRKFSHLVQDLFNDMEIVDNYGGEIYQYMGDGAIISWSLKKGLNKSHFLKSFYVFTKLLEQRHRYYKRKYNLTPQFKAGVHIGKVMVLQVGQIRRDISYNGDTMNTAARIESKCNELRNTMLISGDLYNALTHKTEYKFKNVGEIALRGKRKAVEIYGVKVK